MKASAVSPGKVVMNKRIQTNTQQAGVIIVGAGTSGLALAFNLKKRDIQVVILDADAEAGSAWRQRHDQLRLNTHRWLSALPGKPLPRRYGAFVSRRDYLDYLHQYADWLATEHGIDIRYGISVKRLTKKEGLWVLQTSEGLFRATQVVLATGPEQIPHVPVRKGQETCQIEQKHASAFGAVEDYRGKRVLIVGGANSGIDIANCLVRSGCSQSLAISMREGTHLLPTKLFGLPTQLTAPLLTSLPLSVQDRIGALMSYLCFGDLEKWGIRKPPTGVCSRLMQEGTAPGFDDGFVRAVKSGNFKVFPDIKRFREHSVEFVDGSTLECDVVIFATGYRTGLPALIGHLDVLDEKGRPRVHAPTINTAHPGLWLFGMRPRLEGNIFSRVKEARQLAARIARLQSRYKAMGCPEEVAEGC